MAFIIQQKAQPGLGQLLGAGLSQGLQQGLSEFLAKRESSKEAEKTASALEGLGFISKEEGEALKKTGFPQTKDMGKAITSLVQTRAKSPLKIESTGQLNELLLKFGFKEEEAERLSQLYPNLTIGGQTKFADYLLDRIQRVPLEAGEEEEFVLEPGMEIPKTAAQASLNRMEEKEEIESPQLAAVDKKAALEPAEIEAKPQKLMVPTKAAMDAELFEGLTPKEKVSRQKELSVENNKDFHAATDRLKTSRKIGAQLGTLEILNNKKGALPTGAKKLFTVDLKTGDMRYTGLANADTQLFIKVVNDFTSGAKDTFGARVTNFELDRFMARLPTLANTPNGRREIIAYMKAINNLNNVYDKYALSIYNKYGLRGIDSQKADELVRRLAGKELDEAEQGVKDSIRANDLFEGKKNLPKDHVMVDYEGKYRSVPKSKINAALKKGARLIK